MRRNQKIAIVGGGLGGLATAHALTYHGIQAEVFEQAASLGEIGAGINLSPQAVMALTAIGLGEQLVAAANVSKGIFTRDMHSGDELAYLDMRNATSTFGAPFLTFHRADLVEVLSKTIDPSNLHLKHRLVGLEDGPTDIKLTFENGATCTADVVIGADGVHSLVRRKLYGEDQPQYTGQMVWRAMLSGRDIDPDILEPTGHVRWVGPGRHFFGYYLRQQEMINIVTQQDTDQWVDEGWSIPGDPDEMRASFPNPEPRLEMLLSKVTECSKWGLFLRPVSTDWGRGRIQLIGDAAHAMLPNAGQGAGQAFEDAYAVARWLVAEKDNPVKALENFRRIRIPRVHGVQQRAAANARMFHMHDRKQRDAQLKNAESKRGGGIMNWIYGYNPVSEWNKSPTVPMIE